VVVLKVGTSSVIDVATQRVKVSSLARVAETIVRLQAAGHRVVLVSSGAVGMGCARMGRKEKPTTLAGKQAAAAVGQSRLMSLWDDLFSVLGIRVAQVLLTYDTFGERNQYTNARNTFLELLEWGVVPIVNENDTCAVQELRVGDNDTMSALVAAMVNARWLFLLTDVESLFTADPRVAPDAAPIRVVPCAAIASLRRQMAAGAPRLAVVADDGDAGPSAGAAARSDATVTVASGAAVAVAGGGAIAAAATTAAAVAVAVATPSGAPSGGAGSTFGTGGMLTKLKAAQLGTAAGVAVVITSTERIEEVAAILEQRGSRGAGASPAGGPASSSSSPPSTSALAFVDAAIGTTFSPALAPVTGRKRWILGLAPAGTLVVDAGAVKAIVDHRKSLFPAGVRVVTGTFDTQDAVNIVDEAGTELARALVNYSSDDLRRIQGRQSKEIEALVGYPGAEAVADRDHIVIFKRKA